jgi:uncharacterized membrane protein/2-hydroxychromene-2-carboxylate isomerase
VLGLAGIALAVALARLHVNAHAGERSFCAINAAFDCDRVATSRWSVVLGLPVATWGGLGYLTAALLAGLGLARRRPHATWPRGLLFLVAAAATLASAALAVVSELVIGSLCLLCAAGWAIAVALLVAAWRACRPAGVRASIGADLAVLRAHAGRTAAVGLAALVLLLVAVRAYPRYWDRPARAPAGATAGGTTAGGTRSGVVVEYSDYDCPFCAKAHFETKELLATLPRVKLVRRHFPLDPDCNVAVKRAVHPGACDLARAGICGEAQGRFAELDDALFAGQGKREPLEVVAARVGLEVAAFRACLASPATEARLQEDISSAVAAGLKATPTYVVDGKLFEGRFPLELFAPAAAAPASNGAR